MGGKRVAIIGAGVIARGGHIPCVRKCGDEVVLVVDPDPRALEKARALAPAAEMVAGARLDSWQGVDCAIVCTPPALHAPQVEALLRRGIPVLCEKPLAVGLSDAERLSSTAQAKGVLLQAGYWRRFQPAFAALRRIIREKELGSLESCRIRAGHIFRNYPASLADPALSGGGALADFGVHVLDLLLGLGDGFEVESYRDDAHGALEANAHLHGRLQVESASVPVEVLLSRTRPLGYAAVWEFEKGRLVQDLERGHALEMLERGRRSLLGSDHARSCRMPLGPPRTYLGYFMLQWRDFTDRLAGRSSGPADLGQAVRVCALADRCYAMRQPWEPEWGD